MWPLGHAITKRTGTIRHRLFSGSAEQDGCCLCPGFGLNRLPKSLSHLGGAVSFHLLRFNARQLGQKCLPMLQPVQSLRIAQSGPQTPMRDLPEAKRL